MLPNCFLEKAQSGLLFEMVAKQEIYSPAVLVNGNLKVLPLTIDLDVRLVHWTALAHLISCLSERLTPTAA